MHSSAEFAFDQQKLHVLVAEDDPDQSDLLRDALESEGYAVDTAFSGEIALRRLGEKAYAAAIMDVRMPGIGGGAVLKVCHAKSPPVLAPIIMISAFATEKDLEQFKNDGAAAYFSKPYDIHELLHKVHELADTSVCRL